MTNNAMICLKAFLDAINNGEVTCNELAGITSLIDSKSCLKKHYEIHKESMEDTWITKNSENDFNIIIMHENIIKYHTEKLGL